MGTIFQKIDEEKIEAIEQIVKISDLRQMIERNIDCCNSECSWYCFKQDLEIEVKNGYTSFNNCVFLDDVKVRLREDKPRIEFSNCIFKGKVSFQVISNSSNTTNSVVTRNCTIDIRCTSNTCIDIYIFKCNIVSNTCKASYNQFSKWTC